MNKAWGASLVPTLSLDSIHNSAILVFRSLAQTDPCAQ